ncbi:MAG: A24 family peptidase [Gemmatales bacterium]|nr:A24 family peptidase [Gemmatales bacterium]MDW7994469.1 A24 family peptidase [Gemmatales bacterium]
MALFFPNAWFGWGWLALLWAIVFVAAYMDFRRYLIPKPLTVTLFGLGLLANLVRGAWLGLHEKSVWVLPHGIWLGALDGLLFALAGFLTGFGLFFALWLLRTCGGGDVKLFAAIGAWIGPVLSLWVLGISIVLVAILATLKALYGLITQGPRESLPDLSSRRRAEKELSVQEMLARGQRPKRLMSFSFPLALSLVLFLAWKFRDELHLPKWFSNTTTSSLKR